jgi:pimeloyl-ACP methyl ester carboxylesterase
VVIGDEHEFKNGRSCRFGEEMMIKTNLRIHGKPPFSVAVLHGGPGAAGGMAPLAGELARRRGVLEPLQTASSIAGQVAELKALLEETAESPVTLAGHSWGAWLGFIFAARHPQLVKKLILISSGGFEEKYAAMTQDTRLSRLSEADREEVSGLLEIFRKRSSDSNNGDFARLGELFFRADAYDPIPQGAMAVDFSLDIYKRVWKEATELRRSGKLLNLGKKIQSPVVAIHGDYDSHPFEGVKLPLSAVLENFRFILLDKCGHKPWIERRARDRFFALLEDELRAAE